MTNWIKHWSPKVEFAVIFLVAFSWPLLGSATSLFNQNHADQVTLFTSYGMLWLIVIEVASLTLVVTILYVRAMNFRNLGFNPSWHLTAKGFLLFIVAVLVYKLTVYLVVLFYPAADVHLSRMSFGKPTLITAIALSLINPVFEEVLVVGYVITSLEKLTTTSIALLSSVILRASYHLYLGFASAVGVAALGVLFAYIFYKKRQLWPLIVAHGVINLLSFLAMNHIGMTH